MLLVQTDTFLLKSVLVVQTDTSEFNAHACGTSHASGSDTVNSYCKRCNV